MYASTNACLCNDMRKFVYIYYNYTSGTEEEYTELEQLLEDISTYMRPC